jgi:D-amino-acid dehydrogenase
MGIETRFGAEVRSLEAPAFGACQVRTDKGDLAADAIVVAAGIRSAALARMVGVKLPLCPVQGHSISVPIPPGNRPSVTVAHEARKVFISPCGQGVRAAGIADIVGYGRKLKPERIELLKQTVSSLYPSARLDQDIDPWTGLRDMTHDGPPIVCGIPHSALWFNAGHGTLGWTFACGAAMLVSSMVQSRTAEPDNPFFGLSRRWAT